MSAAVPGCSGRYRVFPPLPDTLRCGTPLRSCRASLRADANTGVCHPKPPAPRRRSMVQLCRTQRNSNVEYQFDPDQPKGLSVIRRISSPNEWISVALALLRDNTRPLTEASLTTPASRL